MQQIEPWKWIHLAQAQAIGTATHRIWNINVVSHTRTHTQLTIEFICRVN